MKDLSSQSMKVSRRSVASKERLMNAALKLFSEYGVHGVAVPRIAKEAGISTGSIYNYFKSKDDLANELFWHWKFVLKSSYLNEFPLHASIKTQFDFIWSCLFRFAADNPTAFQFVEGQSHSSYLYEECFVLEEEVFEIGRIFVRMGQAEGIIVKEDPQLVVSFYFGAFVQYFKDTRSNRQLWSWENTLAYRDLCWNAILLSTDCKDDEGRTNRMRGVVEY